MAINDLVPTEMNALLFKHDSTYGAYPGTVEHTEDTLVIDGHEIRVLQERDPASLPWGDLGVDIVVESTGLFTDATKARAHLDAGARKVIISAPAKNEDITVVLGVNEDAYDPATHDVISNASCTTNCLAPAAKVVHDNWTITRGLMNTIHSYTNDQRVLDVAHADPRRARAAGLEHHPDDDRRREGAVARHPGPQGQVHGFSLRVPTPTVSVVDFTAQLERPASVEELNAAFRSAAAGPLEGDPGRVRRAARLLGLPGRLAQLDHRRGLDDEPRRRLREGHRLVRQRVGIQLPGRRPGRVRRRPARRPRRGRRLSRGTATAARGLVTPPPPAHRGTMDKLTVRDFDPAGKRVLSVSISTSPSRTAGSGTTRASGPRSRRSRTCSSAARRSSS